jgi:hypothetical protein
VEGSQWLRLVLAALATWRLTHLVAFEDGPWQVIARIRRRAGSGFWGSLMDCFNCLSFWAAAGVTAVLRPLPWDWPLVWLGLAGAACLLERIAREPVVIQQLEPEGASHAVLRTESGEGQDRGGAAAGVGAGEPGSNR